MSAQCVYKFFFHYTFLLSVCWFCSDDSEATVSSKSSVTSCSPRWIVYHDMGGLGPDWVSASTQAECLACVNDPHCIAVQWTSGSGCWIHHEHQPRYQRSEDMTEFVIVRQCNLKSSNQLILQNFFVNANLYILFLLAQSLVILF